EKINREKECYLGDAFSTHEIDFIMEKSKYNIGSEFLKFINSKIDGNHTFIIEGITMSENMGDKKKWYP
ncbi:MAG: hypothetical protein II563_08750, partial [Treponema sp.]|nr:hypothetical protein [Treponema sp.]